MEEQVEDQVEKKKVSGRIVLWKLNLYGSVLILILFLLQLFFSK